jgi:transcriptional regulator with XRE-family HTH domain
MVRLIHKEFIRRIAMPILAAVKIGDNVKAVRRRKLMTQVQVAEKAGVSHRTLVNIETNKVDPHFSTIHKLAEALGVEPSELVDEE